MAFVNFPILVYIFVYQKWLLAAILKKDLWTFYEYDLCAWGILLTYFLDYIQILRDCALFFYSDY